MSQMFDQTEGKLPDGCVLILIISFRHSQNYLIITCQFRKKKLNIPKTIIKLADTIDCRCQNGTDSLLKNTNF